VHIKALPVRGAVKSEAEPSTLQAVLHSRRLPQEHTDCSR